MAISAIISARSSSASSSARSVGWCCRAGSGSACCGLWTVVVGIAAAFVGTGIASGLGVADTRGFDWIELLIQVALAAVGVGALDRARAGRRVQR